MRAAKAIHETQTSFNLLAYFFPLIPFFGLIPNFFIPPELGFNGLATQENGFAWMLMLLTGVCLVEMLRRRKDAPAARNDLILTGVLAAFFGWQVIGLLRGPDIFEGIRIAGLWFGFFALFCAGLYSLREQSAVWLMTAVDIVTMILAISQLYEFYLYPTEQFGVFFSHGITAELIALVLPLQIVRYLTTPGWRAAIVLLLVIGLDFAAMVINLRRGPAGGVALAGVGIAVALLCKWIRLADVKRLLLALGIVVVVAAPVVYLRWDMVVQRFQGATSIKGTGELGLISRLRNWGTTIEMIKRNPVIGTGTGGYVTHYGDYRQYFVGNPAWATIAQAAESEDSDEIRNPHAHSEYLETTADLGVIGLLLFLGFWGFVLWRLWRGQKAPRGELSLGALFALLSFALSSALSGFSLRFTPGVIFSCCIVLIGLAAGRMPEEKAEEERGVRIPWIPVAAVTLVALGLTVAFIWRTGQVLASQKLQSGTDFRYSFKPGENQIFEGHYRQALSADPYNSGAHLGYGLLLYQLKRNDESMEHVDYAIRHGYGRPFARVLQAFNHEAKGQLSEAARLMEQSVTGFPKSVPLRVYYQLLLTRTGDIEKARAQDEALKGLDLRYAALWRLVLTMKPDAAAAAAKEQNMGNTDTLGPTLLRAIAQGRAFHYLK